LKHATVSGSNYRMDIQSLRGLSVLAVVLFHTKESFFPMGYLGVDVFFIISGYVVSPLIFRAFETDTRAEVVKNLRFFFWKRFMRLAPALGVMLMLSAILVFLLANTADHRKFALQGIFTILLLGNFGAHNFAGDYFAPNPNPLIHTWSLSVEEQIYFLIPLVIFVLYRFVKKSGFNIYIIYLVLSCASFLFFILASLSLVNIHPDLLFYSPFTRLWQFCLGGIIVIFKINLKPQSYLGLTSGFFLIGFLFLGNFIPFGISNSVAIVITSFLTFLLISSRGLEVLPQFFARICIWLGDRSYSIYLIHMPLLYIARYSPLPAIGDPKYRITLILIFSLIFVLGALSYSNVEQFFRDRKQISGEGNFKHKRLSIFLLIAPLFLLTAMLYLEPRSYYGLSQAPVAPKIPAGDWDKNCSFHNGSIPCEYSPISSKGRLLLIGDSHAAAISSAVVKSANKSSLSAEVWTASTCPFVLRRTLGDINVKEGWDYCLNHNEKVFNYISSSIPKVVTITFRSPHFVPGYLPISEMEFRSLLLENIRLITKLGVEVLIVGPVPEFRINPIIKSIQRNSIDTYFKTIENPLFWKNYASQFEFTYIDVAKLFCNAKVCKNKDFNGWFYEDGGHLSIYGASFLEKDIRNYLEKFPILQVKS